MELEGCILVAQTKTWGWTGGCWDWKWKVWRAIDQLSPQFTETWLTSINAQMLSKLTIVWECIYIYAVECTACCCVFQTCVLLLLFMLFIFGQNIAQILNSSFLFYFFPVFVFISYLLFYTLSIKVNASAQHSLIFIYYIERYTGKVRIESLRLAKERFSHYRMEHWWFKLCPQSFLT